MSPKRTSTHLFTAALLYSVALSLVAAHGDDKAESDGRMMGMPMAQDHGHLSATTLPVETLPSYFQHSQYGSYMLIHIVIMSFAWIIAMPLTIVMTIGRSNWAAATHFGFHILNCLGLLTGFIYSRAAPDLYVHNSHNPVGWILSTFAVAYTLLTLLATYSTTRSEDCRNEQMSALNMSLHDEMHGVVNSYNARWSRDSGHSSIGSSASTLRNSRQNSSDEVHRKLEDPISPLQDVELPQEDPDSEHEQRGLLNSTPLGKFAKHSLLVSKHPARACRVIQVVIEKTILLLGFTAICTGFVVYGGFFRDREIFSGLAHFIKGGIFFWYGLLTMGRWMGAFGEFGWAWNVRPAHPAVARWKTRIPSAEFVESFVIWSYGTSNVFLEHLNNWGGEWSAQDLEHISITLLFFGGGLLGMVLEAGWVRNLLHVNTRIQEQKETEQGHGSGYRKIEDEAAWSEPGTYRTSLNPMPALTIMLLGMMMSGHHQDSMVSTMMHAQWGGLFTAFAFARAVTYVLQYLRPPTSHYPNRPPSELVAAFCLTSGGIMFMLSAHDIVSGIESNGLDAMTIFTVTMGFTCVLLAWEILVFVIKGWAVRRARGALTNQMQALP